MTTRRIAILAAVLATLALASSASARPHPRDRHGCYANTTSAHYTTPTFRLAQTWGTRKSNLIVSSNIACSTAGALVRHLDARRDEHRAAHAGPARLRPRRI